MAKRKRSEVAAAGTKADPARVKAWEPEGLAAMGGAQGTASGVAGAALPESAHPEWAPHMDGKRERLTSRIFTAVEVVLVAIPVAVIVMFCVARGGLTSETLGAAFKSDPTFVIEFLAACIQPFVAYLLRLVHKRYAQGDAGYAAGNLIGLICAQMLMQNIAGVIGIAILLWRTWRNVGPHFNDWLGERHLGGVLLDVSGAIVVLLLAAVCAFARSRIG